MGNQTPIQVFEGNIADAERLLQLTRVLLNTRTYRMRKERREAFGTAMRIPRKHWDSLDCVESDSIFVVLKPGGVARRAHFDEPELRPLLRQAVVAIAAAVEAYISEKASCFIADALRGDLPPRLRDVSVSFDDVMWLESYQRRGWGHRRLLADYLEREASADPAKIGKVFSTVGKAGFWPKVDAHRGVVKGRSQKDLQSLADRRNRIAHTGDRAGRGRAHLTVSEVDQFYGNAKSVVEALEAVL